MATVKVVEQGRLEFKKDLASESKFIETLNKVIDLA